MPETSKNSTILRTYLLGQIDDEERLTRIEERLLSDAEFFAELEFVEEELIEDYAAERLEEAELNNFRLLFLNVPERREKIRLTRALYSLASEEKTERKEFGFFAKRFFQPRFAVVFIALCFAVAAFSAFWFGFRRARTEDSLARLRTIYKTERPVQARVSGFDYAPFIVLRGAAKENKNQLERRKIELDLSAKAENEPNAENFDRLGLYYLTEKRFDEAAAEFKKALESNPQTAEFHNNLAAAFFEKAKTTTGDADKSGILAAALDELNKALESNPNQPDAVFNKALVLRELNRKSEAATVWREYLEKDRESKWTDEARRNLREDDKF